MTSTETATLNAVRVQHLLWCWTMKAAVTSGPESIRLRMAAIRAEVGGE